MKRTYLLGAVLLFGLLTSCETTETDWTPPENNNPQPEHPAPTAQEFSALRDMALDNITQEFTFTNTNDWMTFTSESGVTISIYGGCLTHNGMPVTGEVTLEYAEIFNSGDMLVTGMTTMGVNADGNAELLVSGGEFYVNATQNGEQLELNCGFQLSIPASLTGGADNDMTLWTGVIDQDGNMVWEQEDDEENPDQENGVFIEGGAYGVFGGQFGWTNVDRFMSDPRPKTKLYVDVPEGFTPENCAVYISYNEEGNALANLDTFDEETGYFTEHYGYIPIGLECNVIFVSEQDGQWIYAIKAVTIEENRVITFTDADMGTVTEAQLIALINALP